MKKLEKYIDKQFKSIDYLIRKPANTYKSITFHRLRIRIKKLHSLVNFFNDCFEDFKMKKCFKPFDQVFQQAGKVRELQIEQAKLKKYFSDNSLPQYKIAFEKNQLKAREVFSSILKDFQPALLEKTIKYLHPYIKKIKRECIKKYINKKENRIREIVNDGFSQNKKIHELRKELKNFQYTQTSTGIKFKNELALKSHILSDLLGKWHDYRIILKHLENINSKKIKQPENKKIEKIKLNFTSKSAVLLNQVLSKLPS